MRYEIRPVTPAEWRKSRDLRLTALQDPVAPVAFARTYAEESAMSDEAWQRRAGGVGAQQFVAVTSALEPDADHDVADPVDDRADDHPAAANGDGCGTWVGMSVVVVEREDYYSVNAVYLLPEVRGSGLADRLFAAAVAWTWERTDRLYLWVHEKNPRAEGFYRRMGFERTGESMVSPLDASATEFELVLARA
jgi:GNAT superfamily N-acetyltransferase